MLRCPSHLRQFAIVAGLLLPALTSTTGAQNPPSQTSEPEAANAQAPSAQSAQSANDSAPTASAMPVGSAEAENSSALTEQAIETAIEAIDANGELDETLRAALKERLQRAKQALGKAASDRRQEAQYEAATETAPRRQDELRSELEGLPADPAPLAADASVAELTGLLSSASETLREASKRETDLTAEPARRQSRLAEIPTLISEAEQELAEVREQAAQPPPANESEAESVARQMLLKARLQELEARLAKLESERAFYTATVDLLPLERQLAEATTRLQRERVEALQEAIARRQREEVQQVADQWRQAVDELPKSLRGLAQKNIELTQQQQALIEEEAEQEKHLLDIQAAREKVRGDFQAAEKRVEAVGLTEALGLLLRQHRQDAETLRYRFRTPTDFRDTVRQYQVNAFQLEDELVKIDRYLDDRQRPQMDWRSDTIPWKDLAVEDAGWILLRKQRQLIEDTLKTQNSVLQTMLLSDTSTRELIETIEEFTGFVDRNLFWTRSAPAVSWREFAVTPDALAWLTAPQQWSSLARQVAFSMESHPLASGTLILAAIALFLFRPRVRKILRDEGQAARRWNATMRPTLVAVLATVVDAIAWPTLFATASYLLLATGTAGAMALGWGGAFAAVAMYVGSRELLRSVCRDEGLAHRHFAWTDELRVYLRTYLRWYAIVGSLCIIPLAVFYRNPDLAERNLVTRFSSICLFAVTAGFHHIFLRKGSPIYKQVVIRNPESRIYRWQKLWWGIAVILPLVFLVMTAMGFLDTTFRLGRSVQSTVMLLVGVVLLLELLSRWMMLRKRDVARRKAKESQQQREVEAAQQEQRTAALEVGIPLQKEEGIDWESLDEQTRRTTTTVAALVTLIGLVWIWSDLLPALAYLGEKQLWTVGIGDAIEVVSWLDVLYAVVGLVLTIYVTRALPGFLELWVLGRTSLDSGARYAVASLARYALIVLGTLIVLSFLSVPYEQLGWLLAAASVGLGFGLQEIVANFVSGIILLLERPVRVGDVVTIDDTTGVVSRIQMRATTVTNWDRKELVIPNKDLITQKLLNWSLTNVINRLTVEVGVAYGTDPDRVREILLRVVEAHPSVLKDPAPLISFETFGDSSLNFAVRVFLEKLDNRIAVTHQINTAIANAFRDAGIEIPFPQRDLHVAFADGAKPEAFEQHRQALEEAGE